MLFHDFHLRGYSVSEGGRKIELHLAVDRPGAAQQSANIEFAGVVCYNFSHTEDAIITRIDEEPLRDFVSREGAFLESAATNDGLRLWHHDLGDYLRRLEEGGYHAWRLESAIGFSGFVVAREIRQM